MFDAERFKLGEKLLPPPLTDLFDAGTAIGGDDLQSIGMFLEYLRNE